ncbi:hypothetical protein [Hymenobacter sp. GOD-10R]|uniref:hypothetical protein n=1 Tax=Hymenobacter sp. GOD-10R TaxID=3093922 RepID=UPI002D767AD1|nr:hypothetical protein [Hymenobacter sp. GOD-10R]WRQ27250.1 hypothetical protein SD425_19445 [Hymenobacter sp. GOD-10R]
MRKLALGLWMQLCFVGLLCPTVGVSQQKSTAVVSSRHALGNLRNDTLLLAADYSECGEFGGHHEVIKVYMRGQERTQMRNSPDWEAFPLTVAWFLDSTQCPQPKVKLVFRKQRQIKVEDEAAIVQYIQTLLSENLKDNGMTMSNAGNRYSLRKAQRKDLQIDYWDTQSTWSGFEVLREKLFGK